MPPNTRTKRTSKSANVSSSGLLYTTYEFIQRLRARGRTLRLDVRDLLLQWVQLRTIASDNGDTTNATLWDPECPDLQRHLSQVPPLDDAKAVVPLLRLCTRLAPLQLYELQYLNLAIVLHSLTIMEIKNLYRFCYLEWMAHHTSGASTTPPSHLWTYTPRQFAALHGNALSDAWDGVLDGMVSNPCDSERASHGLFFVNRLFAYLTPCG